MKNRFKFICICVALSLCLIGCSREDYMREDTKPKRGTYVPPEPKFELSQYTIAQLYNAGLPKQILKSATGETFTVIMPKFHEGVWAQDMNVSCPDFHFSIIPPGTYYDEDGKLLKEYIITSLEFVSKEDYDTYDTNVWRSLLLSYMAEEDTYDEKRFESYADYVAQYKESVNSLFKPTAEEATILQLTGELEPIKGARLIDKIVWGEEEFLLPWSTFRFSLGTGNYLYMRVNKVTDFSLNQLAPDGLLSRFVLPSRDVRKSDVKALKGFLTESLFDTTPVAEEMISGVIIGDYSSYWTPVKVDPVTKDDVSTTFEEEDKKEVEEEEEKDTVSGNETETFGSDVNIKQQQYLDKLKEGITNIIPDGATDVISGFSDEDTYGGYNGYGTGGGDYFED